LDFVFKFRKGVVEMKRLLYFLSIVVLTLVFIAPSHATPLYYTFQGTVQTISDLTGIIGPLGYHLASGGNPASSVTYVVLIDLAAAGTYTRNNNTVVTQIDNVAQDFFFADFVSGDALPVQAGGKNSGATLIKEYNYGTNLITTHNGSLSLNSDNNLLQFNTSNPLQTVNQWVPGSTTVRALTQSYNATTMSTMMSVVTLIDWNWGVCEEKIQEINEFVELIEFVELLGLKSNKRAHRSRGRWAFWYK
jgi:hypothetical protein